MKELKVKIKNVYGNDLMYPACSESQMFCDIANSKTITDSLKKILEKNGYKITSIL